jgi:hypothetical protein
MPTKELSKIEQLESLERSFKKDLPVSSVALRRLENSYHELDAKRTEINFGLNSTSKKWLEKIRAASNWVKEDAKESLEMMQNMINNPKQAFIDFGNGAKVIYDLVKLSLSENSNKINSESNILKQEYPNPLAVFANGKVQNIGKKTLLMGVEGVKNGRIEKKDDGEFYLEGRRIIGKNNKIDGGGYPGSSFDSDGKYVREIIVADFDKDKAVQIFYAKLVTEITESEDNNIENIIKIYNKLLSPMINEKKSDELANLYKDKKVQLGLFLVQGGVVCRHNAVLFALMVEKMKENGIINYDCECTIERHGGKWKGSEGNHAYCKIKTKKGIFIADAVQRESGKLQKVGKINPYAAEGDLTNPFNLNQSVKVLRSNNNLESWNVKSIIRDPEDHMNDMVIVGTTEKYIKIQKSLPLKMLMDWQNIG